MKYKYKFKSFLELYDFIFKGIIWSSYMPIVKVTLINGTFQNRKLRRLKNNISNIN